MRVSRSIETAASPQRVWPLLVQPEGILKWFTLLESFKYTSEPPHGPGATFHYEERSGGRLMKLDYRVTAWVENERLAFTLVSGPLRKDGQVWEIEALPMGSRVTLEEDIELSGGVFGRMLLALGVGKMIGRHLQEMLVNLKALAEA
ncbi:MAG: SRPBCC family protein [Actinomycetota bacterium]